MKICVTGSKGRLGSALVNLAGYTPLICDITKQGEVEAAIDDENPDVIINCAAKTKVDDAEKDYDSFLKVNSTAVRNFYPFIVMGGKFIHLSTDYVFDGRSGPYKESDKPIDDGLLELSVTEPVNAYGWSKFGGEESCRQAFIGNVCIVRTTGLYGFGNDFASYFFEKFSSRTTFDAVTRLRGNHTYIPHLVSMIEQLLGLNVLPNIIHLASEDVMSRYDFCKLMAEIFSFELQSHSSCENYSRVDC